ncbi:hypothetical protein [Pyxidicoccus trucidator]|uniref:hypothetical protein n=1 Tax=Pyxidicoccus trucidator TaxID=2709662 RepID=UPI0013D9B6D2|nr:hypothetical protein [Pyxidicoccus trucidator]
MLRALLTRYLWDSTTGVLTVSLLLGSVLALPAWFHLLDRGRHTVAVEELRPGDFTGTTSRRVVVNARPDVWGAYESSLRPRGGTERWLCVQLLSSQGPATADSESVWALIPIEEERSAEEVAEGLEHQRRFEGVLRNVLWEQWESEDRLIGPDTPRGHPNAMVVQVGRNQQTDLASIIGSYVFWSVAGIMLVLLRRPARASPAT